MSADQRSNLRNDETPRTMTAERAKWWTYLIFVVVALLVVFLNDSPGSALRMFALGALGSFSVVLVAEIALRMQLIRLFLLSWLRYRGKLIRISISYLIRVRLDNEYLLIWSDRFKQFQPVGGVYKRLPGATPVFDRLGVLEDDKLPIQDDMRGDLRVRVRGENVPAFLAWFETRTQREVGPWREFYQELVEPDLLPRDRFSFVMFRWLRRHNTGFQFSEYFQCFEVKVAEIFQAELTPEQEDAIRQAVSERPGQLCLAEATTIRRRGVTRKAPQDSIAETAGWLLS